MLHTNNYQAFEIRSERHFAVNTLLHTFNGPAKAGRALPGDIVEWQEAEDRCALIKRTIHPPLTGLLDICSKTLYGMTSRHVPIFLFYPYDKRYPPMRVGCSTADRSTNLLVTVRFEDWPSGETWPRANLETVIGPVGDLASEAGALVVSASPFWRKKVNYKTPVADLSSHKELPTTEEAEWFVFHIDPAGCVDVDDVIGIQCRVDGRTNLLIGISDVAAYIPSGGDLDHVAYYNTSTVYSLNGTALRSMLPSALSEGVLSLLPTRSKDKKAIVGLTCIYDGNKFTDIAFGNYVVPVHETFTYESIMAGRKTCNCTGDACEIADIQGGDLQIRRPLPLDYIRNLLSSIACSIARRIADADAVINVGEIAGNSHIWIEQLMIFYNLEAAQILADSGRGVFRSCEEVAAAQLEAVSQLPHSLQWIANKPAVYTNDPDTQHSKFAGLYCQVTSPIRRYVDLYNQRHLKEAVAVEAIAATTAITSRSSWQLITHLNTRSKQIRSYQRHLAFLSAILQTNEKTVQATVVDICETKARLYINSWKTIVNTIEYSDLTLGDSITLQFYYNPNRPNWKERMVFEIVPQDLQPQVE